MRPFGALPRIAGRILAMALVPAGLVLAGCGGGTTASTNSSNGTFSISPGTAAIDTNCTGCASGASVEQFTATLNAGGPATVTWSQSPTGQAYGSINSTTGQYTPPGYLTADSLKVTITAALTSNPAVKASASLTITPGFLQPITPENVALGGNGTVTLTGYIAEAGGSLGINYALSSTANGSSGGQGSLGSPVCTRNSQTFTSCTVKYTAPATVSATGATYIVGTVGSSSSKDSSEVLLNTAGVSSNPATHENQQGTPISLGTSGGNDKDYDTSTSGGQTNITDCCGGTLGSLVQDSSGNQYILSNNHVLARSDQASIGETIDQPGLIDDNCTPTSQPGAAVTPVGTLTGFLSLKSNATNADAAIAKVSSSSVVNSSGNILELGTKNSDGTLAAAPPGISSTGGKGETPVVNMTVAKSGRTTGLTCASITTVSLNVQVSYYTDCAETKPYYTKTYSNQIGIEGNQFSDAGDSGSLVVDSSNAEPVGLFFAGGPATGPGGTTVEEGVANPVSDVLGELSSQVGNGTSYTFVGATDHPVSCLNYGANPPSVSAAQAVTLAGAETNRAQQAMGTARMLVNSSNGILGVATGKSSDHAGESAVIVYVDQNAKVSVPATIDGVRTMVVPTTASAVAMGAAPATPLEASAVPALTGAALSQAIATKEQLVQSLMQTPAYFGVGVGQSFDNPREAALVIYVDRRQVPAQLPATIGGMRTRYVIMDRLHVTRSYLSPIPRRSHCSVQPKPLADFDPLGPKARQLLNLQ